MQDNDPINLTYGQVSDLINRIEQVPSLSGTGAPTSATPAFHLGQTYVDTTTGKLYFCSEIIEESGEADSFVWLETGKSYTAGTNITIDANNQISAVDTKYTAGTNISIDANNQISATDTKYTAGTNVNISSLNVISATDTKYTAGTGLSLSGTQFNVDTNTIAQKSDIKDATLTIQRNGSQVGTFSANASSNSTVNIAVPTNNNELINGAGYQNSTQVQNAINTAVAGITSFDYQVVQALPASGVKGTIYLVPSDESGSLENTYEEYIWVQEQGQAGHWEQIGSTAVKLNEVSDADWEALFGTTIEDANNEGF